MDSPIPIFGDPPGERNSQAKEDGVEKMDIRDMTPLKIIRDFDWHRLPRINWKEDLGPEAEDVEVLTPPADQKELLLKKMEAGLLISCLSKTLEETDFFRLGPKGDHIENWTSGITRGESISTHDHYGH
jgi:hypothetical protein